MDAKLVSIPESMVDELRDAVPFPTVQLIRYESPSPHPFGVRMEELFNMGHSINKHFSSLVSIRLPDNLPQALLHAYLRVRHSSYIYALYKVGKTLLIKPNIVEEFQLLELPDDCDTTDGFLLEELLNLLAQVIRMAEDCGTICALYSLLESIHPTKAGTKFNFFNNGERSKKNKRAIGQVLQEHALDIDVSRLEDMVKEVSEGPFKSGLEHFKNSAVFSLMDVFVGLVSPFPKDTLQRAVTAFKALNIKKPTTMRVQARDIVLLLMERMASEESHSFDVGSIGILSLALQGEEDVPSVTLICHAICVACECIISALTHVDLPFLGGYSVEEMSAVNFQTLEELDVDQLPALHDLHSCTSAVSYPLISEKVKAFLSFLSAEITKAESRLNGRRDSKTSIAWSEWACVVFCRTRLATVRHIYFPGVLLNSMMIDIP